MAWLMPVADDDKCDAHWGSVWGCGWMASGKVQVKSYRVEFGGETSCDKHAWFLMIVDVLSGKQAWLYFGPSAVLFDGVSASILEVFCQLQYLKYFFNCSNLVVHKTNTLFGWFTDLLFGLCCCCVDVLLSNSNVDSKQNGRTYRIYNI